MVIFQKYFAGTFLDKFLAPRHKITFRGPATANVDSTLGQCDYWLHLS